ncbi:MAG TPA: hypothetical protein VF661_12075 [Actinomycetales bacterium]|jgi:hypothetical protein
MTSWSSRVRDDDGAASVEQTGTVALAALVVVGVILAVSGVGPGSVGSEAVCRVRAAVGLGACAPGQGAPLTDADYEPTNCKVREESESGGYEVSYGFFSVGEEYGFIEQTFSDGTVRHTLVDKASLGAKFEGAKFDVGKIAADGTGNKGQIEVAAGLKFAYGTTWQFKDADEAESFRGEIEKYQIQMMQMRGRGGAGIAIWNSLTDNWADPPDPAITYASAGFEASAKGALGLNLGTGGTSASGTPSTADPNIGADLTIKGDYQVIIENNSRDDTRSYTYQISGSAKGTATAVTETVGYGGTTTGAMKVTRNDEGELVSITYITTREHGATEGSSGKSPVEVGSTTGKAKEGTETTTADVTTTTVKFDTPEKRVLGDQYLSGANEQFGSPLSMTYQSVVPSTAPADGNAWEQFMYENATVAQTTYENIKNVEEFGAKISLGLKFGATVKLESSDSQVQDASYLGAPRGDGTRPLVPFTACQ